MYPDMTVAEYRKYATLRVEALNHALRDIPEEKIRLHICWGSNHGPHKNDLPFSDIIDIFLRGRAGCYSFEFANPRHEHEWRVWEDVKLPEGKTIMPGVVGHATDIIEHPRLVADRLILFRETGRQGKRHRRHGLRPVGALEPCRTDLGQARSAGRGCADRHQGTVGPLRRPHTAGGSRSPLYSSLQNGPP